MVFSAVTDPVAAKLVPKLDGSGTNVTGASDALPYAPQIDLMRQIIPSLKNVGYVYSPGEVNSTIVLKALKENLTPLGINVHERLRSVVTILRWPLVALKVKSI